MRSIDPQQNPGSSMTMPTASKSTPPSAGLDNRYLQLLLELSRYQSQLDEYRLRTEAMINGIGEGLIMTDEQGKITTANPYALNCLGYTEKELIGTWFPKTVISVDQHSHPVDPLIRPIVRALTSGRAVSDYTNYLRKNGSIVPVFVTVAPVLINDRPVGAIEIFRDLTRERELEIAKDEFVSLASHQLRTPATGVKLILSMLQAGDFGPLNETQKRYLSKAIHSNDRQLTIIEDLLSVAQVDAGKMELDLDYVDLTQLLHDAVSDQLAIIETRRQTIQLDTPSKMMALVDGSKIRMVIDNLLSNASKYSMPEGIIKLSLGADKEGIILECADHGVGISKANLVRLFTKFTRINNELSTAVGGTGLGLFLVKNIVELHDGTVSVTSKEQIGSTFTVRLPAKPRPF